mgnify:CR=1 FL=1
MSLFYNVTGSSSVTTELLAPNNLTGAKFVLLTNIHATDAATVTLFIQNDPASGTTETYNIIYLVNVPAKSALLLDKTELFQFDEEFGLYCR